MNTKLQSFNNDEAFKKDLLKEVAKHRKADQLIKGSYGYANDPNFRGCAVGCSIDSLNRLKGLSISPNSHADLARQLQIPQQLIRLQDRIFENLPQEEAMKWPEQFYKAIPVGVDLTMAYWKFMEWLLINEKEGVIRFAKSDEQKNAIKASANLFSRMIAGENVNYKDCETTRKVCWKVRRNAIAAVAAVADAAAAAYVAYAAAAAAAAYVADAAAYVAYAAAVADAADAKDNATIRQSKKLLELFKASK